MSTEAVAIVVTGDVGALLARKCEGCGLVFVPKHRSQTHHNGACYDRAYNRTHPVVRRQRVIPGESRVERAFAAWIDSPAGRYVEAEVVRRARELRARGREHYGVKAILEVVRFHMPTPDPGSRRAADEEFKINNNYSSLLARRIMERHGELRGFFETRQLRGAA